MGFEPHVFSGFFWNSKTEQKIFILIRIKINLIPQFINSFQLFLTPTRLKSSIPPKEMKISCNLMWIRLSFFKNEEKNDKLRSRRVTIKISSGECKKIISINIYRMWVREKCWIKGAFDKFFSSSRLSLTRSLFFILSALYFIWLSPKKIMQCNEILINSSDN